MPVKLRHWRLTADEFDSNLKPYLNRMAPKNVDNLYAMLVENKTQAEVAGKAGVRPSTMNILIRRAWKVYIDANVQRQKPITEFVEDTEK